MTERQTPRLKVYSLIGQFQLNILQMLSGKSYKQAEQTVGG